MPAGTADHLRSRSGKYNNTFVRISNKAPSGAGSSVASHVHACGGAVQGQRVWRSIVGTSDPRIHPRHAQVHGHVQGSTAVLTWEI
jgi:hypothetical protein